MTTQDSSSVFRLKIVFAFIALFCITSAFAQKEANNWNFGYGGGLTFNTDPVTTTYSNLYAREGCASISDADGNLLFYTDGKLVFTKNHTLMQNGTGLLGDAFSTQSALIVKKPGSITEYYIFTVPDQSTDGRYTYSIVDMSLNGGLGAVTSVKNRLLLTDFSNPSSVFDATEALTATYHSNQIDIWVVVHESNSTRYYSYLLTAAGIENPVGSFVGGPITSYMGQCRLSPDGTKIALGGYFGTGAEMCNFNSATGVISNRITVVPPPVQIYGLSFSPNSNVLYVTTDNASLYQYDVSKTTEAEIQASSYLVGVGSGGYYPQLQLGPDKRLYMAQSSRDYLGIITSPDVIGAGCNFADQGIFFISGGSALGLPTFMVNYITPRPPIVDLGNDTTICGNVALLLDAKNPGATYLWSTGEQTQTITVSSAGTYHVDVISNGITSSDEIIVTVTEFSPLNLSDYIPAVFCKETDVSFSMHPVFSETDFQWSDGSNTLPFTVADAGDYWLERRIERCSVRDYFSVASHCPVLPMIIPNLITINGDGMNDTFYIANLPLNTWNVIIYNRWGNLVYKQEPYQNNWDCHGAVDGIYFFELYRPDSDQKYKGWVQLMR